MKHESIEKNTGLMAILILIVIAAGGLVEIVPLLFQPTTTQADPGIKPLPALVLEGRDIYIREGCHVCHTQMIRPLRGDTERYGNPSTAGEHVYEHPFLWGSKRTGPDLARVGNRYSNDWHREHLYNPRSVVPESIMPAYSWLEKRTLDGKDTATKMKGLRMVGVPYTDEDIAQAEQEVAGHTEIEAVIAYLQQLGTNVKPGAKN